jgi:hypothetical protein
MVRSLTFGGVLALACCTALPALAQDIVTERAIRQGEQSGNVPRATPCAIWPTKISWLKQP